MAEPESQSHCNGCDHICENNYLNPDSECWGKMTAAERLAIGQLIIADSKETNAPTTTQTK